MWLDCSLRCSKEPVTLLNYMISFRDFTPVFKSAVLMHWNVVCLFHPRSGVAYGVLEIGDFLVGGEDNMLLLLRIKSQSIVGMWHSCVRNESVVFSCRLLSSSGSYWFWRRNVWVKIDGHFSFFYFSVTLRKSSINRKLICVTRFIKKG